MQNPNQILLPELWKASDKLFQRATAHRVGELLEHHVCERIKEQYSIHYTSVSDNYFRINQLG